MSDALGGVLMVNVGVSRVSLFVESPDPIGVRVHGQDSQVVVLSRIVPENSDLREVHAVCRPLHLEAVFQGRFVLPGSCTSVDNRAAP